MNFLALFSTSLLGSDRTFLACMQGLVQSILGVYSSFSHSASSEYSLTYPLPQGEPEQGGLDVSVAWIALPGAVATTTSTTTSANTTSTSTTSNTTERMSCEVNVKDVSSYPYPGTRQQMPLWEIVVKCAIVGILTITAVIGNVLIIVIVSVSKKMRTTTNYYIVNLALADLLVACFPMWIYVVTDVTDGWIVGGFLCKFNAFVQTSAMCAISFTMMAIAGDRFFAIVFPLKARVTQRKVKVVVCLVWLGAISIGIPPLVFYTYTERQWMDYRETFCTDVWPVIQRADGSCDQGVTSERAYWTVVVAVLNWIPMVMMTVIYTVIIHRLRFNRMSHGGSDSMSAVQRRSTARVIKMFSTLLIIFMFQVIKMLFTLLITFMACSLPFQVVTMFENYKDRQDQLPPWYQPVYFSAILLMYTHSAVNPIVYGAMNQTFRKGFRHLINRIRGRKLTSWESQLTVLENTRFPVSVVGNGHLDPKLTAPANGLEPNSCHVNQAIGEE